MLAVTSLGVNPGLTSPGSFAVPLMLMALPVLDTVTVTLSRLRRGRSVALGGQDHLSHRLVAIGFSPGAAVRVLVAVAGMVGMLAVLVGRGWWPLASAAAAATVLGALTLATVRAPVYLEQVVGFPGRVKQAGVAAVTCLTLLVSVTAISAARANEPAVAGADPTNGVEASPPVAPATDGPVGRSADHQHLAIAGSAVDYLSALHQR